MTDTGATTNGADDNRVTGQQWYWTALSAMASYLDAGSIVAIAAGLAKKPVVRVSQRPVRPVFSLDTRFAVASLDV